jgi:pimeloyl-ACP methyl ester carboxylesterase
MPELQRDDVTIHFADQGRGQPIIMVHGHTLDRRIFDPVVAHLADRNLRLLRPDLRGHGRSDRPEFGYHWSDHAADIRAVMAEAGVERAVVLGFSLGGGVALEMAVTAPELVTGLVLVSPVMPDRPFEAAFLDNLKAVAKVARTQGIGDAMRGPWMESPLFAASFDKPGVREATAGIVADFPGADYLATKRDVIERDWAMPERLSEIAVPTRVMIGANDMPGFRAYAEEAAGGIPGATLVVVEGAGHLLPLEAPQRVAEVVVATVER